MASSSPSTIPIHVTSNSKALVWSVDDVRSLRVKHNICGSLTGTLPGITQQNVFLGLPLSLMPEEVVLLVENGIAHLIDDPYSVQPPNTIQLAHERSLLLDDIHSQQADIARTEVERRTQSAVMELTPAQKEKRDKRIRDKEEKLRLAKEAAGEEPDVFAPSQPQPPTPSSSSTTTPNTLPTSSTSPTSHLPIALSQAYMLETPSLSSPLPYYDPSAVTYTTLDAAREAGVWTYPSNLDERARSGVFRALWERGYFMGVGIKFGGGFLVYPGDPLRYHSHFVSTAVLSETQTIRPMELVAWGRLGTATKKAHLIAGWDDEKKEVEFWSLEWASF
ncbi:hypothetical protein BDY24DRAFT_386878 [Mrakia frigida]|uniref:tRNA splicing endonuclease subunit SEN34 n=1 Tax=Mrakia frigida TaxID=29902 RepID=UPI003FCC202E